MLLVSLLILLLFYRPNKVSHIIEVSFSLYVVKSAGYSLDQSIIKSKVESMISTKTGLTVNAASFSFEG